MGTVTILFYEGRKRLETSCRNKSSEVGLPKIGCTIWREAVGGSHGDEVSSRIHAPFRRTAEESIIMTYVLQKNRDCPH